MWYKLQWIYVWADKVRPTGWKPWANTVLYLPLNWDVKDPYNNVTYSWGTWSAMYDTWSTGVQAAKFWWSNAISIWTSLDFTWGNGEITICYWFTTTAPSRDQRCSQNKSWKYFNITGITSSKVRLYVMHTNTSTAANITGTTTLTANTKYLYTATIKSSWDIKLYLNWQLENSATIWPLKSLTSQFWQCIWAWRQWNSEFWRWMIREFIVEDRIWTDQEIADYYTQTS